MADDEEPPAKIEMWIPGFDGFHEGSSYDSECDSNFNSELEHMKEQERELPQRLRIQEDKLADILVDCVDWFPTEGKEIWAKDWMQGFNQAVLNATNLDLDLGLEFVSVGGEIRCKADPEIIRAFWVMSMLDRHDTLLDILMGNKGNGVPDTWEDLDVEDTGLLIRAVLVKRGLWDDVETAVREWVWDSGDVGYQVWDKCVDWEKLRTKIEEAHNDIKEKLGELEPRVERCPWTPDLFALAA